MCSVGGGEGGRTSTWMPWPLLEGSGSMGSRCSSLQGSSRKVPGPFVLTESLRGGRNSEQRSAGSLGGPVSLGPTWDRGAVPSFSLFLPPFILTPLWGSLGLTHPRKL